MTIERKKISLKEIFERIDQPESDRFLLGEEALTIIDDILQNNPFDLTARVDKMWLYTDWVFNQTDKIINEAEFIIEHNEFGNRRTVGYDWLYRVYYNILNMPEKAAAILEEELIDIQNFSFKRFEKEQIEGEIFNKWAFLEYENGNDESARDLWLKSFDKEPLISGRNAVAGMFFLDRKHWEEAEKFLAMHYEWSFENEDGYRLQYGMKLKELYDARKLDEHPGLTGLMFNIIRNEQQHFQVEGKLDFYDKFFPELKEIAGKHPGNTLLWNAVANTYYFDIKNDDKAFESFSVLAQTKQSFRYNHIKRFYYSADASGKDFFDIPFKFEHLPARTLYGILTDLLEISHDTENTPAKLKLLELAIQAGKTGYSKFYNSIVAEQGESENNQPHIFAMLCKNYGDAVRSYGYIRYHEEDEEKMSVYYQDAANIRMQGYEISPFPENLAEASFDYFMAKQYTKSIEVSKNLIEQFYEELSVYDLQNEYWQMTYSYIRLKDFNNAEKYYYIAKDFFINYGKGNKDAQYKFIFTAKLFYQFAVVDLNDCKSVVSEMEWYLNEEIALAQEPNEHGLVQYFLALCYQNNGDNEKAIASFRQSIAYLEKSDDLFYTNKAAEASEHLKEMGVTVPKKKTSWRNRLKNILLFPIGLITVLGLVVVAILSDNNSKE